VKEPAVADNTCLIGLERIGRLDLLQSLFEPILIPPKVQEEFGVTLEWLKVQAPSNQMLVNVLKFVEDEGGRSHHIGFGNLPSDSRKATAFGDSAVKEINR
jgi:predicted nucleic acid-binding protein